MGIERTHRRVLRTETLVSIGINALIPAAIIWAIGKSPPRTLFAQDAILGNLLPAAGLATFVMTLLLTSIVRARVCRGGLPELDWPRAGRGLLRHVPQNLFMRAVVLAFAAMVLLVPVGLAAASLFNLLPMTRVGFLAFNIGFGALVGLVMAPPVVLPALADPVSRVAAAAGPARDVTSPQNAA